ncbi:MAG: hypothetical protein ACR2KL_13480 [Nocardioidaceae bacterium]
MALLSKSRRLSAAAASVTLAAASITLAASPALAVTKLSQSQAAGQLSSAGVTSSSSGGCTDRYNSTCTSFEQINQSTVSGVITLHRASGCSVNITGGTETGHASGTYSHWNGYKVDISKYTCVGSYIKNNFAYAGYRGDGYPMWKAPSGNVYTDEGSHWDILYYSCGC